MPRRSSGGGRSRSSGFSMPSRASSPPKPKTASTPAPRPAPRPAPVQTGSGGLGSAIAEGMAFGGGSAIAHRAVDALVGPRVVMHETVASSPAAQQTPSVNSVGAADACGNQYGAFKDCLNSSASEISKCQFYMDMLAECRKGSSPSGLIV